MDPPPSMPPVPLGMLDRGRGNDPERSRTDKDIAEQFGTGEWAFDEDVAAVFPEHVRASVPHYDLIQDLVTELTDWLVPAGGLVADLGAATGNTCALIQERRVDRAPRFVLYDESAPMLEQAKAVLSAAGATFEIWQQSVQNPPLSHNDADLTLILFTLQFMGVRDRVAALRNARAASAESGALVVAEKIRPPDSRWAEIGADVSHDWKAGHGISDTAIRAKSRALRGILIPRPMGLLTAQIESAGWHSPEILFRWHQWAVVGAYAHPGI